MGRLFNMRCYVEMQLFLFCVRVEAEKLDGRTKVFFFLCVWITVQWNNNEK